MKTIELKTVETIESNAFIGCIGLTSITIPSTIKSIGDNAFASLSGLTTVNYEGEKND